MNKLFFEVWNDVLAFAKNHMEIETLSRNNENEIVSVNNESITVKSKKTVKEDENLRILLKDDFQYAWTCLFSKKILRLNDIEPKLRGKKSIIFTFLAKACKPYISYTVRPLRLNLNLGTS